MATPASNLSKKKTFKKIKSGRVFWFSTPALNKTRKPDQTFLKGFLFIEKNKNARGIQTIKFITAVGAKMATFRLFVQHGRPLSSSQDEQELKQLFEKYGRVTSLVTRRGDWRNSLVSFASTGEAQRAKQELDKHRFREGMQLQIFFTKPSHRVLVRGLPDRASFEAVKREFRGASRVEQDGADMVAVTFDTISDAQAVVAAGRVFQGRTLSFDFGNDRREERREARRRSSPSPVMTRRKRSRSPSRRKKSSTRLSSSSSSSSLSEKKMEKKEKSESLGLLSDSDPEVFAEAAEAREYAKREQAAREEQDAPEDEQDKDGPCRVCKELLDDVKSHVTRNHAESGMSIHKATLKAWFETHYSRRSDGAAGEKPVTVNRSTLLKEINTFSKSMGWPEWKTQSPMYKDWFLREVMALSDDDIKKGRNWSLFYKDGFAPGGIVGNARTKEQRFAELTAKLKEYMEI